MIDVCSECALRLFNVKHYNLKGVGNPFYGKCIVVPNVDYNAYKRGDMSFSSQVEVIKSVLSSTGELDDVYIVPLIRCNEKITCGLDEISYNRCLHWFADDIRKYQFTDVLLLGEAASRFLQCEITNNLNTLVISKNDIRYAINYAPLIKYVSEDKFEIFKRNLLKWYNSVINKDYSGYNVVYT